MKVKNKSMVLVVAAFLMTESLMAKDVVVQVNGMVCAFCAQGLTKTLKKENGVENVNVDLNTKLVKVTLKDGQDIADDKLTSLVTDSGFSVEKIRRE